MSAYTLPHFYGRKVYKELRRDCPSFPGLKGVKEDEAVRNLTLKAISNFYVDRDVQTMSYLFGEYWLESHKNETLFIDSERLVSFLDGCRYSIDPCAVPLHRNTFKWYSFPLINVRTFPLRSVLIGYWSVDDFVREIQKLLTLVALPGTKSAWDIPACHEDVIIFGLPQGTHVQSYTIPARNLSNVLKGEFHDVISSQVSPITSKTAQDHAFLLFRLALASEVYAAAFPETVVDGPPQSRDRSVRDYPGQAQRITGTHKVENPHASPSLHWRRGHFRSLRNERFKRDENGGVRIVFVRDTIVAGNLDAKTELAIEDIKS